jgi:hypothetical protein
MFALLDDLMTAPWVWHDMHHPEIVFTLEREEAWYFALDRTHRWMAITWNDLTREAANLRRVYLGEEPWAIVDTDDEVYDDPRSDVKRKADQIREQPCDAPGVQVKRRKAPLPLLNLEAPLNRGFWVDCPKGLVEGDEVMSTYEHIDGLTRLDNPDYM